MCQCNCDDSLCANFSNPIQANSKIRYETSKATPLVNHRETFIMQLKSIQTTKKENFSFQIIWKANFHSLFSLWKGFFQPNKGCFSDK